MKEVFIVSAKRTPIGGFLGNFAHLSATELGSIAMKNVYESINIESQTIDTTYMGNVLSANLGQAPARQAAIYAGIPNHVDSTTINKVCASGMKATMIGAQQIQLGLEHLIITGGMESMSNAPHYSYHRKHQKTGDINIIDGLIKDGLTDAYHQFHMGNAAEICARKYNLSREAQDEYAIQSYEKACRASSLGKLKNEIIPIEVSNKNEKKTILEDEDIRKIILEKVSKLKPVFEIDGTITAANASNLSDGAAAILLASKEYVEKYNLEPMAKIISYADAAQAPEWFTTSPAIAIPKALKAAGLNLNSIDFFEINEAYAAVMLANLSILQLDSKKVNIYGGAIAMGHPLGASGARIICTLLSVLKEEGGKYGVAAICNGGGGASAMVIENLNFK